MGREYDVVIIGGGAAGMTAGLYGANQGLKTVVLERMMPGAQIVNVEKIENFPAFPDGPTGGMFAALLQEQAMKGGVEVVMGEATGLARQDPYRIVTTADGAYRAKAVIIAAGSTLRRLGVPGEEALFGKGVSQCATCDGPLFQGGTVAVVGGGDSAADEALALTAYAAQVYLIHQGATLRAQQVLQDRIRAAGTIQVLCRTAVEQILGEEAVTGVQLRDRDAQTARTLEVTGVFVFTGLAPNTQFLNGQIAVDAGGHIPVTLWMETALAGVYAAGDIRQHSARQLVSAAGDGATAALAAYRYLESRSWR